ncbi:hypothetical protein DOTSEDRAFT_35311 [Lecanosticta acicola]|uniref:TAFII28-like protein domain-containing protein n=1 Tax=Lecanosticta acicola TaxID=111012 RepID=A0AAI9EC34_9PEZI|nr:hypothetical protein DOTSEDRAFT_35311 [Lecanosticta acicola]
MASPPAGSPPSSTPLALPRQRPGAPGGLSLALPKSRKPSLAPSTGSAHPLRQTSFPPPDSLEAQHQAAEDHALREFSPGDGEDLDDISDTEITSAVSGPTGDAAFVGQKRKRGGEKKGRGRHTKSQSVRMGSASVVNGDDGRSTTAGKRGGTAGAASLVNGEAEDDEDDEDEGDVGVNAADGAFNAQTLEQDNQRRYLFREAVNQDHQDRYDAYNRVKLKNSDVKRLVNQTLSQSVPPNVIAVVQAYTKMFAGMLIEGAREVQTEWMAAYPKRPDDGDCRAYKRLKLMQEEAEEEEEEEEDKVEEIEEGEKDKQAPKENGEKIPNGQPSSPEDVKPVNLDAIAESDPSRPSSSSKTQDTSQTQPDSQTNGQPNGTSQSQTNGEKKTEVDEDVLEDLDYAQPGAWGLSKYVDECDRGPLLPDHLRESLRRYKKSRGGGTVGFTAISLERPEVAAPRMGGKRLFR